MIALVLRFPTFRAFSMPTRTTAGGEHDAVSMELCWAGYPTLIQRHPLTAAI